MTRRHHSVKRLAGELSVAEEFIIALGRERLWRGFKKCERMNISSCCRGGGGGGGGSLREQLRYHGKIEVCPSVVQLDAPQRQGNILLHLFGTKM